jgi:predicted Co/Zn/Cd cation transporter (cation efflux family)
MTNKDYAEIQRNLGYIEGLITDCNTIVFDGISASVDAIDKILDREMKTKTAEEMVGEG